MLKLTHLFLPAIGSFGVAPSGSSGGMDSKQFLAKAMQDSLAEIETCNLALEKTSDDDIKAFSERMIEDHSKMGQEVERLAGKCQLELPKDIDREQQKTFQELSKLSGRDFDKKFAEHNVHDHEKDVEVFKKHSQQADDPEIKEFAERGVKILSSHMEMARQIGQKLGALH